MFLLPKWSKSTVSHALLLCNSHFVSTHIYAHTHTLSAICVLLFFRQEGTTQAPISQPLLFRHCRGQTTSPRDCYSSLRPNLFHTAAKANRQRVLRGGPFPSLHYIFGCKEGGHRGEQGQGGQEGVVHPELDERRGAGSTEEDRAEAAEAQLFEPTVLEQESLKEGRN